MSGQDVEQMLKALGSRMSRIEVITKDENTAWLCLPVHDDGSLLTEITVVYLPKVRKLLLIASLGKPTEENKDATYEILLNFSYMWSENGGMRAALNDEGNFDLLSHIPLPDLTVHGLDIAILNFSARAMILKTIMNKGGFQDSTDNEIDYLTLAMNSIILM